MEQQLTITGMKCEGCASHVETSLSSIDTVHQVVVNLDEQIAQVDSLKGISKDQAQAALSATAYQVTAIQ